MVLSAKADDELRVKLLRAGAQDFLTKPFAVEELHARVDNLLERRRLERELRLSHEKLSGIVTISADAIVSADEDDRVTLFNEGAEKMYGCTREEMLGAPLERLLPERFRPGHRQHLVEFRAGPDVSRLMGARTRPLFGLRKNGEEFPAQGSISKLRVDGRWIVTTALHDVTEQLRRERDNELLAKVGAVFATSLDSEATLTNIAQLATREVADFCVIDCALEKEGVLRRVACSSRDPSGGWICEILMQVEFKRRSPPLAQSVLETKQPRLFQRPSPETLASLAQGEEHMRALNALNARSILSVPLLARGEVLGVITLVSSGREYGPEDVQLAQELAHRAALAIDNARLYGSAQRALRARDDVLGVVAHDLRNPLQSIFLQTAHLRRRAAEPDQLALKKPTEFIERAASRMARLIQDLLDATLVDSGRPLALVQDRLEVGAVIAQAVEAQRPLAAAAGLELRVETQGGLPEAWADRDRVLQVLENLLGNALKFTPRGGVVTVAAARQGDGLVFRVSDTGVGMPAADLAHVFDRFWQAKRERRGAGLGLAIVKGLIDAHGGRLWVESQVGAGTTFHFTLPLAPSP